ncbi:MAG: iron response transcriptional regulator IrrA [Methylovirgula sp.]
MLNFAYQPIPAQVNERRPAAEPRALNVRGLLNHCGIRPTRQRLSLAALLFSKGNRHVTAEALLAEARAARVQASYATIYNVLKCFSDAGLVRCLAVEGHPMIFDTNTSPHHHFFFEDSAKITDLAFGDVMITGLPQPPEGYEIAKVDVVVRLRPKKKVTQPAND